MKIDDFKVEDWFNKYEKYAKYDLADTCVESFSINELLELTNSNLDTIFDKKLNYGDIYGSNRLKNAITNLYKNQQKDNITITHGAIGANQLVILTLVEPKDKVVSVIPTYQQHYSIPKSLGANVSLFYLKEENNWLPDLNELKKTVAKDTKLICINNPNNPTGSLIPDDMMFEIVEIAKKSNAYILCDEVYRGLNHEGEHFSLSIADIYDKGISTSSVSKVFSLAGLRLGWICASNSIIKKINLQREYNTISVGILDDYFASIAIENKDIIIKRNIEKIKKGKDIVKNWLLQEQNLNWVEPKSGTTAFLSYNFDINSYDLCKKLQQDTKVLFLPGQTMEYDKFLRIGYGNNFEKLEIALNIFSDWINKNLHNKLYV